MAKNRLLTPEELDAQYAEKARQQRECVHWHAEPSEWWFSTGRVREMTCLDCGLTQAFDEEGKVDV